MVKHVSEAEMRKLVKCVMNNSRGADWTKAIATLEENHSSTYCRISWVESYAVSAGQFWTKIFPLILRLANEHGADNVRMVMSFDS